MTSTSWGKGRPGPQHPPHVELRLDKNILSVRGGGEFSRQKRGTTLQRSQQVIVRRSQYPYVQSHRCRHQIALEVRAPPIHRIPTEGRRLGNQRGEIVDHDFRQFADRNDVLARCDWPRCAECGSPIFGSHCYLHLIWRLVPVTSFSTVISLIRAHSSPTNLTPIEEGFETILAHGAIFVL